MEVFELYTRLFATVIEGNSSNNLPYTVLRNLDSIAQKLVDVTKDCTVKNLKHYNHSAIKIMMEVSMLMLYDLLRLIARGKNGMPTLAYIGWWC
ncbi:hypothetical protein JHK86_004886 [Glycine max]|nr:hypothetical protein JHK86_004886 [Glycine max]